ncbi:hypothetical protein D1BOALGB6SA_8806 [Olavius sp. associated proteobacterium Delta 1]|nr:hypothetical protein D1BOALGB6SA_8806 [Olavius sp. associated proteobacterium Delta 1]
MTKTGLLFGILVIGICYLGFFLNTPPPHQSIFPIYSIGKI